VVVHSCHIDTLFMDLEILEAGKNNPRRPLANTDRKEQDVCQRGVSTAVVERFMSFGLETAIFIGPICTQLWFTGFSVHAKVAFVNIIDGGSQSRHILY
jgi:hypothetical protein